VQEQVLALEARPEQRRREPPRGLVLQLVQQPGLQRQLHPPALAWAAAISASLSTIRPIVSPTGAVLPAGINTAAR